MERKQLTILYIGNDSAVISLFSQHSGVGSVIAKSTTLQALDWLRRHTPDVILCEFVLPKYTGLELFGFLRRGPFGSRPPFLLLHNHYSEIIGSKVIQEGVDDLYFKPLDVDRIIYRIHALIQYDLHTVREGEERDAEKEKQQLSHCRIPIYKRVFDVVVASLALIVLSPVILLAMLAIRIESPGKVYYVSQRVGAGYRVFPFYKLRSMYVGADARLKEMKHLNQYIAAEGNIDPEETEETEEPEACSRCLELGKPCSPTLFLEGREVCERMYLKSKKNNQVSAFIKIKDDPRVTRVGRIIRNTSIDELPQLINVIKGDMSIVGNRPLPLYEAEQLTSDDWSQRFMAPAGITGLWQVELRSRKGNLSERERKILDNYYAKKYSFWRDIWIIIRTFFVLFQKDNR